MNALTLDSINNPMMQSVPKAVMDDHKKSASQRMGEAGDVASFIAFFASRDASYISGACIDCSGAFQT